MKPKKTVEEALDLSIVVPLLNEAENLELLYEQLRSALDDLNKSCEVILVDDGSTDGSFTMLKELRERDGRFRVVRLRRNFGQTAAF